MKRDVLLNILALVVIRNERVSDYNLWEMTNEEGKHKHYRITMNWKLLNVCANTFHETWRPLQELKTKSTLLSLVEK